MRGFSIGIVAIALSVSAPALAGNHSNDKSKISCADAVKHKHPGLTGAAWKAEWAKCANDREGYIAQ